MIISITNAEHYTWGNNCHGWHLVRTPNLSIIEEIMPPSTSETRHRHIHARQFFYILEGELTIEVDHQSHTLHAGEGIEISPGTHHQAINRSAAPVRFLVTSHPPSHGDLVNS